MNEVARKKQGKLRVEINVLNNSLESNELDYPVADRVTTNINGKTRTGLVFCLHTFGTSRQTFLPI